MKLAMRMVILAFGLVAANVYAVSGITITGQIIAKKADITLPTITDSVANVDTLSFTFGQGANPGCRITTNESEAKAYAQTSDDMLCYLEWTLPSGLSAYSGTVSGTLNNYGENIVGYTVSIFSGSSREKVVVETGEMTIDAAQAITPNITDVLTTLTSESVDGYDVVSHSKTGLVKSIKTTVEPRPFDQVVNINGVGTCTVAEGTDNCSINTPSITVVTDPSNTVGTNSYTINVDSSNAYFKNSGSISNHTYSLGWDLRTAELANFALQAVSPGNEQILTTDLNGLTLTLNNEKARIVLTSPHEGEPGTWWNPTAKLVLKADQNYTINTPSYTLGGEDIMQNPDVITLPTGEMEVAPSSVTHENGYWVFEYDISEIPDGIYIPNAIVQDAYNNGWTNAVAESQAIDRHPPTVRLYTSSGSILSSSDEIYFFDDLLVAAVDSMSGAAKVISATVDGVDVLGDGISDGIEYLKYLKTPTSSLEPNTDKTLSVMVEDNAGNRTVSEISLRYMPVTWTIDDRGGTFRKNIQDVSLTLKNTEGPGCRMYASADAARQASASINYRCYVDWLQYPDGLTSTWLNSQLQLKGVFSNITDATHTNLARYNVWMINRKGSEAISYQGNQAFDVKAPEAPSVSYATYREFTDGVFITTVNGGVITTATTEFTNGDLNFTVSDGTESKIYPFSQTGTPDSTKRISRTVSVDSSPLWTSKNIDLTAQYIGDPSVSSTKQFQVYTVPSTSIIASMTAGTAVQNTTSNVTATVHIGIMNYLKRTVEYDATTMGTWKAKFAIQTRNRDGSFTYKYLTDDIPVNADGSVSSDIDFADFDIGSASLVALLTVDSQISGYTKTIKSNSVYFQVYKGLAIDGGINAKRVTGKAPLTVQMLFQPESIDDRRAKGEVDWEMSSDNGATWTTVATSKDYLQTQIATKGLYQFRAKVTNKYSGVVSRTDVQEVLVYDHPTLIIKGVTALHPGESATYTVYDNDEDIDLTTTEVEWSLDGLNWVNTGRTFDLTMEDARYKLQVRAAYIGTELAGDARYATTILNVRQARLQPVRISVPYMRAMEEGVSYDIAPTVALADSAAQTPLKYQWTMPDGTTTDALNVSYTPTAADTTNKTMTFVLEAWADGYKTETLATKTLVLYAWKYSFPTFEVISKTSSTYAPTSGSLLINTPVDLPPYYSGITFSVNWELPDGIDVVRQSEKQLVFNVNAAGVYPIKAYISDSRGQTNVLTAYVTANEAPEPQMSIDPRYSNNMMREPLMVIASLSGKLGHPLDRISSVAWYLDGKLVEPTNTRATITDIPAGVHTLKATMTTKFNIVRDYQMDIPVAKNVAPVCDVKETNYTNIVRLDLVCTDEDGKLAKYEWNINGQISPYIGSYMYVSKTAGYSAVIIARGIDDSGAYSNSIQKTYSY